MFFRLIGLDAEQRYESFPTDQKDNRSWEYLGQRLPSRSETLAEVENWRPEGRGAGIGDSYVAFNAHSGEVEYFRLEKLDAAGRYGPLPTHRTNDDFWTCIGTDMPGQQVKTWGSSDRRGTLGEVYIYDNPYTRKVEYFKLKALGADGRYWYFPIDGKDNVWWTYLGTDLPTPTSRFNLID